MIVRRYAHPMLRALFISVTLLLHGCGTPPEGTGTAQGSDAIALYRAIFAYYETLGAGRITGIYYESYVNFNDGSVRPDCPETRLLIQKMPGIDEDLIALFCVNTATAHPIAPEVLTALSLTPIRPHDAPSAEFLKVSSIQVDLRHEQALVFVEMRKGESRRGSYLFLQRAHDVWIVQDETEMYISSLPSRPHQLNGADSRSTMPLPTTKRRPLAS